MTIVNTAALGTASVLLQPRSDDASSVLAARPPCECVALISLTHPSGRSAFEASGVSAPVASDAGWAKTTLAHK